MDGSGPGERMGFWNASEGDMKAPTSDNKGSVKCIAKLEDQSRLRDCGNGYCPAGIFELYIHEGR